MEQVRVNITLEQAVWRKFSEMVPNRKKSVIINQLLKKDIKERIRREEEKELALAFREAAKDETRLKAINEWASLDAEGWD